MPAASLAALDRYHQQLDELFLLHQEALLVQDFSLSVRCLALYHRALRLHIRQEDTLVLPLYAPLEAGAQWPSRVFSGEHRKLEALLGKVWTALAQLRRRPSRRGVIELIEREKTLKHVAEHHHLRENEALFPALDAALPADQRAALIARIDAEWQRLGAARPARIARLCRRLDQAGGTSTLSR